MRKRNRNRRMRMRMRRIEPDPMSRSLFGVWSMKRGQTGSLRVGLRDRPRQRTVTLLQGRSDCLHCNSGVSCCSSSSGVMLFYSWG
ncbi:hypothetical protein M0804_013431 [Polistes exclamans]|nr:hypothetical protein M0804_013431 [Polistes exclamans]